MELFIAGLVLGVLLALCAAGRGDARAGRGHQPKVPPADWAMQPPPTTTAVRRELRIGTGAKGTQPIGHVNPLPPRPTPRVRRRDDPSGHRGSGPPVDWANVRLPTGGSAVKPPPPQVVRVEHTEARG